MVWMWTCATSPLNVGTHLSQTCTFPVPALSLCGCIASLLLSLQGFLSLLSSILYVVCTTLQPSLLQGSLIPKSLQEGFAVDIL